MRSHWDRTPQTKYALGRPHRDCATMIDRCSHHKSHGKYIGELLNNRFLPETRTEILNIAQRMRSEDGIEALVLAGTELPLLLRDTVSPGIEFLDTTIIHVEAIVNELLR